MKDRVPANPGRVLITPEDGSAAFYATMTRADNPTQEGDPLNKNTLLKDATAALFGLGADAVPDDVLVLIKQLITAANENANSKAKIETGSYEGAGAAGASNPNKLTFQSPPKFVAVQDVSDSPSNDMIFFINGVKRVFTGIDTSLSYALYVTWNGNEVSWYATQYHDDQMNQAGHTYNYIAIL